MNRKFIGVLLGLLILLIAFLSYRSSYIRPPIVNNDKVIEQTKPKSEDIKPEEPNTEELSQKSDSKQGTSSGRSIPEKVQPIAKTTIIPQEKTATALPVKTTPAVKNATAAKPVEVSRGAATIAAEQVKYPKVSKNNGIYGQFHYRETGGGRIEIDPAWIAQNIVTITLPGLNQKVQVHKEAADHFIQAFNYIKNGTAIINGKEVPLLNLIRSMNGTWVARHVNWNPERGLSNHSWGTAMDINASNHFRYIDPSEEPNDPNLILWEKAFKPAGFSWGNSYADSMHFELLK
ncbi:MAG: M15 family metallopeptidase, partial [Syntrophomonas sp.]